MDEHGPPVCSAAAPLRRLADVSSARAARPAASMRALTGRSAQPPTHESVVRSAPSLQSELLRPSRRTDSSDAARPASGVGPVP
eukprot:COSAG02_NODE_924_length_15868_cov_165.380430_1_plen_84_part_00